MVKCLNIGKNIGKPIYRLIYNLNWTKLDDDITEFNYELPLTECLLLSFCITDTLFSYLIL